MRESLIERGGTHPVLVGDGIDTVSVTRTTPSGAGIPRSCDTATVSTYPYGGGDLAAPIRTLTASFPCYPINGRGLNGASLATDGEDRVYVYDWDTIEVFCGCANGSATPMRTIPIPLGFPIAFTVDLTGNIYVLNGDEFAEVFTVAVYDAGNVSGTASRTIGPYRRPVRSAT